MAHGADSAKSIMYALVANSSIAVAKGGAAFVTGSGSMLAESIHSVADAGNQALLLLGLKRAKKPPTPDFPLGYGKATYFWSFIVAVILFSVGGLFSLYEGTHKLSSTEPLSYPWVAVGILIFSIVAEGLSMWGCVKEVNKVRGDRSYWRWFRESRQSELLVVFGEDLAALLGLVFALGAVVLTMVTGNPIYDAIGSLAIGCLLVGVAILIGIEVKGLLMGQSAEPATERAIRAFIEDRPEVAELLNLLTMQLGNDIMIAVKARMAPFESAKAMVAGINQCEAALKEAFPGIMWCFFEPDIRD